MIALIKQRKFNDSTYDPLEDEKILAKMQVIKDKQDADLDKG